MSIYTQVNIWDEDDAFRINKVKEYSPNKLVDLGCGNGRLTFPMLNFVSNIVAIDPDSDSIEEAKSLDISNEINWVVGDSENINAKNLDAITMLTNVSQEITDERKWERTLTDCFSALKLTASMH